VFDGCAIDDEQCGRFAVSVQLGGREPLSSSATNIGFVNAFTPKGRVPTETAKEMMIEDIRITIEDHVHAAKCAIEAGFDAVEIVIPFPTSPISYGGCLADAAWW
jgi:2,4-dienoyl-CoA reductase-like NADH-dependent reductase (Old Yellow Enzyme family)